MGLTKNLRTCPEERIEKARAAMQLKRASQKVSKLPNAEEVMQTLQKEYDVLLQKMTDYYTTKKRIMNLRKKHLMRSMERLELDFKYKELKQSLVLQKEKWLKVSQLEVQFA